MESPEAIRRIKKCIRNREEYLDLSNLHLMKVPQLIKEMNWLKELSLANNLINKIEGLENLSNLLFLNFSSNLLSKIEGLDTLHNLSELIFFDNQITRIEGFDNLSSLSKLYFSSNFITKIEGLEKLNNLSTLDISSNQISQIEGLDNLYNLLELDLSYNKIKKINDLSQDVVKNLITINLEHNPIESTTITDWTNPKVILGYLNELSNQERILNKHIKINIIGTGRIGKTQLLSCLVGDDFVNNCKPTHGMNQRLYSITDEKDSVQASLWDFGGQEYHHGTHTLFLRPKDFNIVFFRSKKEYSYWLGTAKTFSPDADNVKSPLLLVQSVWSEKNDEVVYPDSKKIEQYGLSLEDILFLDVKAYFNKDKKWEQRWHIFKNRLNELITEHAHSFGYIPKSFDRVRQKLIKEPIEKINLTREELLANYANEIDEDSHEYLIDYLQFTGSLLYFNEIESLNDKVFPNPVLLSEWMYKTILDKQVVKDNGIITDKSLQKRIKNKEELASFHLLAEHFKLYFKEPFAEELTYVIPQYLKEYEHSSKKILLDLLPYTFCLHFSDFMHEGHFFSFMSKYGEFAIDNTAYWKYGLLFKHKETGLQTLVYYNSDERKVVVHIEDKKGKTLVAKELFYYFTLQEDLIPFIVKIVVNAIFDKLLLDGTGNKRSRKENVYQGIQLSTNNINFWDIEETIQNIQAKNYFGVCVNTNQRNKLDYMAISLLSNKINKPMVRVFFSYSHKDEKYRDELEKHLTMLKRDGSIETWHDRKIKAGEDWNDKIKQQLETADIILLMISSDFLNSEYIWEQELRIVRERLEKKENVKVVPIFTRPCDITNFDMIRFQGGQEDKQSKLPHISSVSKRERDEIYTQIVEKIRGAINDFKNN